MRSRRHDSPWELGSAAVRWNFGEHPLYKGQDGSVDPGLVVTARDVVKQHPVLHMLRSIAGKPYEVRARHLKAGVQQGALLYPFGSGTHEAIGRPAVAYSPKSDQFFVAVPTSSSRLIGRILASDGSSTSAVEFLFNNTTYYDGMSDDGHGSMHVTHNSILDEFVVTVQLSGSTKTGIWAQRVSAKGQIGSPIQISTSVGNSFGFGYAPIANTSPAGGRYLFANGYAYLFDSSLKPILVTANDPATPTTPTASYIRMWKGQPEGNYDEFDVAYGEVQGKKRFLIVYADSDNCAPGSYPCKGNTLKQWTGIWGTYVDPEKVLYTDLYPSDIHNTPFPISKIWSHVANKYEHNPRVTYSADAKAFFVAWREIPGNDPLNDTKLSHIRGNYVDYDVEDGLYKTTAVPKPNENTAISDISGGSCTTTWGLCLSTEDPDIADVVPAGGTSAMVVWQQKNPLNSANMDVMGDFFDGAPVIDVKVNGSDGVALVALGKDAIVSVSIQAGNRKGQNSDGWAVLFQFDFTTNTWKLFGALLLGQGPLATVPQTNLVNLNSLPKGCYLLSLGVDMNMNGIFDSSPLYYDMVGIVIY